MDFSKLIVLQYIHMSKHHDVHLKLVQCYISVIFQRSWNKPKLTRPSWVWQGTAVLLGTWRGSFREQAGSALAAHEPRETQRLCHSGGVNGWLGQWRGALGKFSLPHSFHSSPAWLCHLEFCDVEQLTQTSDSQIPPSSNDGSWKYFFLFSFPWFVLFLFPFVADFFFH